MKNGILKKISALSLGVAMALGIGVAASHVGKGAVKETKAEEASTTYTLNSESWGSSEGNWTSISDLDGGVASGKYAIPSDGASAISPVAYNSISEVVIRGTKSNKGASTVALYYGATNNPSGSWTLAASKSFATTMTWSFDTPVNGYLKIVATYSKANTYIASIEVNYEIESKETTSLTLTAGGSTRLNLGETVQLTSVVKDSSDNAIEGALVSYSSSDESVASVNEQGLVSASLTKYGSATITATYSGSDDYKGCSSSISVKVSDPDSLKFLQQCKTDADILNGETYVIGAHYDSKLYIMNPVVENVSPTATNMKCRAVEATSAWNDTFGTSNIYTARIDFADYGIEIGVSEDDYTFTLLSGNNLGYSSGTTLTDGTGTTTWSLSLSDSGHGTFRIASTAASNRALAFGSSLTFGGFYTPNIKDEPTSGVYYKDVEIYKVVDFSVTTAGSLSAWAEYFDEMTCNGTTHTYQEGKSWSTMRALFEDADVEAEVKAYFKHAAYTVEGTGAQTVVKAAEGTDLNVAKFVSRYDYMVNIYEEYDYIGRQGTEYDLFSESNSIVNSTIRTSNTSMITVITIVSSAVALSALGALLLLKKKKEQ